MLPMIITPLLYCFLFTFTLPQSINNVANHNKVIAEKLLYENSLVTKGKQQAMDALKLQHRETTSLLKKRHAESIQCTDKMLQDSDDLLQGFQDMSAELLNEMQEVMQRNSLGMLLLLMHSNCNISC